MEKDTKLLNAIMNNDDVSFKDLGFTDYYEMGEMLEQLWAMNLVYYTNEEKAIIKEADEILKVNLNYVEFNE